MSDRCTLSPPALARGSAAGRHRSTACHHCVGVLDGGERGRAAAAAARGSSASAARTARTSPAADGEVGHGAEVLAAGLDRRHQLDRVRARPWPAAARRPGAPTARSSRSRSAAPAPCASAPGPARPRPPAPRRACGRGSACSPRPARRRRRSRSRSPARACRAGSGGVAAGCRRSGRGASDRRRSSPSRAAKHAPESKRGRHSQSIEPSRPTSPAVWVSPIMA